MPVETKCSPIFTIGPFVDHHPHLHHHHHHHHHHPLLHHHHVPWTNRISSSINESDGDRDSSHSSEATNSDHCQLDSTSTTSTESNQSTPPMQYNNENREMSPPTSTTTTSTIVNEKPALPPRPSHLQANSSNHRTKTFNRSSPNRTTPNTPSCPISSGSSPMTSEKEYTERIAKLQMDNLIPLKEDVSGMSLFFNSFFFMFFLIHNVLFTYYICAIFFPIYMRLEELFPCLIVQFSPMRIEFLNRVLCVFRSYIYCCISFNDLKVIS